MQKKGHTKSLAISSILAALIFVFTAFLSFRLTSTSAYMHLGDSIIYCAGLLIGAPWAAGTAAIGSLFADLILGAAEYIPATIIIKGLMGFLCAVMMKKAGFLRFLITSIIAGAIMFVGYALYEVLLGGWGRAYGGLVQNLIQWVAGVAAAAALYYPVKRIKGAI
ncbi:MAG: ECF transporter S component [Burkholderiales bacterium]